MKPENNKKYLELVKKVKNSYPSLDGELLWCEACKEINLWTYWQRRNCGNVRILLVGQDWGCTDGVNAQTLENVREIEMGMPTPYMRGNKSETDGNLIQLFRSIGYDISAGGKQYDDLFFTNFVMGYRRSGNSGNFAPQWAEHDAPFFKSLANLLEPKYIFCLGKDTFLSVLDSMEAHRPPIHSYNTFIRSNGNPVEIRLESGCDVKVCALAHCGRLGTWNRNRRWDKKTGKMQTEDGLAEQIADWRWVLRKEHPGSKPIQMRLAVAEKIRELYRIAKELEEIFPGRNYTPDGHMLGSIGEALAAYYYELDLFPASEKTHDARAKDGRLVQIKTTQINRVALTAKPEILLVLKIQQDGSFEEAYNGPGGSVWENCGRMQKNGQRVISLAKLEKLQIGVPEDQRLSRKTQE